MRMATYILHYEGQAARHTCVVEGCDREVKITKGGLRLCKAHSSKDERPRPSKSRSNQGNEAPKRSVSAERTPEAITEARSAPGESSELPPAKGTEKAALLGKYLRLALEGKGPREALENCATPSCGPHETWEELKDQATQYVAKLPKEYPQLAKKAIIELVTEDCPPRGLESEGEDPVLSIRTPASQSPFSGELAGTPQVATPARNVVPSRATPPAGSNPQAFFRPKGSQDLPTGMTANPSNTIPDAARIFAAASRPRHIGAYSDAEPPQLDETSKALQTIAKAMAAKDEAAGQDRGKVAATGKVEERLVLLVNVSLGAATVGKELFHALRATSTQGRPQLRAMQFPVNISNRIAYGLAAMRFGGKDIKSLPEYCISAADFPLTGEEEFDNWAGCADLKLEKRPKVPVTLNAWYRNALGKPGQLHVFTAPSITLPLNKRQPSC